MQTSTPTDLGFTSVKRCWICYNCGHHYVATTYLGQLDVEVWHEIIWDECNKLTLDQVAEFIEQYQTIDNRAGELQQREVHQWLMEFYATLQLDEATFQTVVNKRAIFPNQNGTFRRKADLSRDAGNIDATLLDILQLLGSDLRGQLLDVEVTTELDDLPTTDGAFVVKEITAIIEKNLDDRAATKRFRPALSKLLLWFREKPSREKSSSRCFMTRSTAL